MPRIHITNYNNVFACFVDLKADFDGIDRRRLDKRMKETKVERHLRDRIVEIYVYRDEE